MHYRVKFGNEKSWLGKFLHFACLYKKDYYIYVIIFKCDDEVEGWYLQGFLVFLARDEDAALPGAEMFKSMHFN